MSVPFSEEGVGLEGFSRCLLVMDEWQCSPVSLSVRKDPAVGFVISAALLSV